MKGEQLLLRALEPQDVATLYEWENCFEEWKYSHNIEPFSREVLTQYVLDPNKDIFSTRQLRLMITLHKSGETVGAIDLFEYDAIHRRAGVGLLVDKKYREQGIACEALHLITKYAKTVLHLHQLYANIAESNTISTALFEKCGFSLTGRKKEWLKTGEQWEDMLFYQQFICT